LICDFSKKKNYFTTVSGSESKSELFFGIGFGSSQIFGFFRIQIHNTGWYSVLITYQDGLGREGDEIETAG
jgi:hypothetical protein